MREVEVVGVRVEMQTNQPLVRLHEAAGTRDRPLCVGAGEAAAVLVYRGAGHGSSPAPRPGGSDADAAGTAWLRVLDRFRSEL